MKKHNSLFKNVTTGVITLALLLTSAASLIGCDKTDADTTSDSLIGCDSTDVDTMAASISELKSSIADLSTAEQIAALESKLETLTDAEAIAEVKNMIDQLSTAEQIAALESKMSEFADEEDVAELESMIEKLASSEQLSSLADALIPEEEGPLAADYAEEAYEKFLYIDKVIKNRDCLAGEKFKLAQKWIIFNLIEAGYKENVDIVKQDTTMTQYIKIKENASDYAKAYPAVDKVEISEETYKRSGRNYVVATEGDGTHVKATFHTPNIVVTKPGKSEKTIIVGAHYDGDGSGDNGSSVALALTTAQHLYDVETEYTIKFVFFTAEEYGLYGSTAYVEAMTEEEIANTLYMINMDSLVCGDYCYLYGGVQDDANKTVTQTEAYENAMKLAGEAGLTFKSNPWTWDSPAPGYEVPAYAAPSTGDWSDHAPFKYAGIQYIYFEATNWDIPGPYNEYDGYGETYLVGMLMNTKNDYVEYIETYFPGRPMAHLKQFSTLLNKLLTQTDYGA